MAGQRKRSVVSEGTGEDEVITTTEYTYVGLSLQELSATQDGAQTASWTITYLHDESGRPYAGIYRDDATQDPQFFLLVTSDRGDVVSLTDKNGSPFAAYRYDPWGDPVGEVSPPSVVRHEEDDQDLDYQGTWTTTQDQEASAGSLTSTDETGAWVTYEFTGTSIDWITTTSATQGIASVTLDGGTPELIDLHSESTLHQESVWTSGTLEAGTHTLVIAWTGTKNENSTGTTIGVDALDVTGVVDSGHPATGVWVQETVDAESETVISAELAETISQRQVLRYAGYYYDTESDFYYLSARHYDPETRLFLSKDPSRNDGEQSAYQYCGGNPIKFVDPTGYSPDAYSTRDNRANAIFELVKYYQARYARNMVQSAIDQGVKPVVPRGGEDTNLYDVRGLDLSSNLRLAQTLVPLQHRMTSLDVEEVMSGWLYDESTMCTGRGPSSDVHSLLVIDGRSGIVYEPLTNCVAIGLLEAATGLGDNTLPGAHEANSEMRWWGRRDTGVGTASPVEITKDDFRDDLFYGSIVALASAFIPKEYAQLQPVVAIGTTIYMLLNMDPPRGSVYEGGSGDPWEEYSWMFLGK